MNDPVEPRVQMTPTKIENRQLAITKLDSSANVRVGGLHRDILTEDDDREGATTIRGRLYCDVAYSTAMVFEGQGTFVPVLAIDDKPVTAGFGEVEVQVEPGWHLITTQIQDPVERSVKSYPVFVEDGNTEYFDYVGSAQRWRGAGSLKAHAQIGNLGRRGITRAILTGNSRIIRAIGAYSAAILSFPLFLCPAAIIANTIQPESIAAQVVVVTLVAALVIGGPVSVGRMKVLGERRQRKILAARRDFGVELGKNEPALWPNDHPSVSRLFCLGQGDECDLDPVDGKVAILLDLRLRQGMKNSLSELELTDNKELPDPARMYCPAPRVYLDGQLLPPGWTRWWVELEPGRHVLRTDLVDDEGRRSGERGASVDQEVVVDLSAGQVQTISIHADIEYDFEATVKNMPGFKLIADFSYKSRTESLRAKIDPT